MVAIVGIGRIDAAAVEVQVVADGGITLGRGPVVAVATDVVHRPAIVPDVTGRWEVVRASNNRVLVKAVRQLVKATIHRRSLVRSRQVPLTSNARAGCLCCRVLVIVPSQVMRIILVSRNWTSKRATRRSRLSCYAGC